MFALMKTHAIRLMVNRGQSLDLELEKRANTVVAVVRRVVLFLLWTLIALASLQELGVRIEPLLAGAGLSAGIVGVAVGFGAQTLIKDMIAGAFMLIENQIRVNDVAVINGTGGLVEEINLRTTVLRAENGAVHIFPNGSIQTLSNLTREYAFYVFEAALRFEEDTDRVLAILSALASDLRGDSLYTASILEPLEVMGVDRFLPSGVVVKARIKTLPQRQWMVGREMNRRIRMRFAAEGILQPEAAVVRVDGKKLDVPREDLKAAVRAVLEEIGVPGAKKN
jgi:small conductance mechanosensitive channel